MAWQVEGFQFRLWSRDSSDEGAASLHLGGWYVQRKGEGGKKREGGGQRPRNGDEGEKKEAGKVNRT